MITLENPKLPVEGIFYKSNLLGKSIIINLKEDQTDVLSQLILMAKSKWSIGSAAE